MRRMMRMRTAYITTVRKRMMSITASDIFAEYTPKKAFSNTESPSKT